MAFLALSKFGKPLGVLNLRRCFKSRGKGTPFPRCVLLATRWKAIPREGVEIFFVRLLHIQSNWKITNNENHKNCIRSHRAYKRGIKWHYQISLNHKETAASKTQSRVQRPSNLIEGFWGHIHISLLQSLEINFPFEFKTTKLEIEKVLHDKFKSFNVLENLENEVWTPLAKPPTS